MDYFSELYGAIGKAKQFDTMNWGHKCFASMKKKWTLTFQMGEKLELFLAR